MVSSILMRFSQNKEHRFGRTKNGDFLLMSRVFILIRLEAHCDLKLFLGLYRQMLQFDSLVWGSLMLAPITSKIIVA